MSNRSIKYSNAAIAGQQVAINGQKFGLFVVQGQNVYLSLSAKEKPTNATIDRLEGIYYPQRKWSQHCAKGNEFEPIRAEIMQQIETAVLYGCGIKKVGGKEVAIISAVDMQGGVSVLNKAKINKMFSTDLAEIKDFLAKNHPKTPIIELF